MADTANLLLLLEAAAGYALFDVVSYDEIAGILQDEAVTDLSRFGRAVKLRAFGPFATAAEALENANAVSEHAMTPTLHHFLELNLPSSSSSSKKSRTAAWALGIIDPALATSITEGLPDTICRSDDTIRELCRGCRLHLDTLVRGLAGGAALKAQLGLGHSYSRSKVKFNPARADNMIIQSIALLDQLDKDVNTFAMRVREWYSWHFPELKDIVKDNVMFAKCAAHIQDKRTLFHSSAAIQKKKDSDDDDNNDDAVMDTGVDKMPGLLKIVMDQDMADLIVAAAKTSMGMDCSELDMLNICNFTQRMVKLAEYRQQLSLYLSEKMSIVAPNLAALIGDTVAARLISKAGSLTNLAKAPASTVQILGAEKALFRALKTKGNTPKYGLLYHSTFIGRADAKNKGRISRYLANKCSIATRIDSFADGTPSSLYGERLRDQVEERLRFYETGTAPRRNIDVMEQVAKELKAASAAGDTKSGGDGDVDMVAAADNAHDDLQGKKVSEKKKKKDKKRKTMDPPVDDEDDKGDDEDEVDDKATKKSAKKAKKDKKKKKSKSM